MSFLVAGVHTAAAGTLSSRLVQHIGVCALAVGICCLLAIPAALWLGRRHRDGGSSRGAVVTVTVVDIAARVVPALALLAALSLVAARVRVHDATAVTVLALVALGLPPLLAAGYRAVRSVDPGVGEVSRGLGMSGRQELLGVDLPLVTPALLAGLRRCSVRIIGVATTAALIGGPGLGELITSGLGVHDDREVLAGAATVTALALVVDLVLSGLGRLSGRRLPR